jgi:hypothetical protein
MTTTAHRSPGRTRTGPTPAQVFALVVGLVYLLIGLAGWAVTEGFTGRDPSVDLLGFDVNGLHNVVHLALGIGWLAAARMPGSARAVNMLFGAVLLVVGLAGLTGVLDELLNIDGGTAPDNFLHIGTGVLSLVFAGLGERRAATART